MSRIKIDLSAEDCNAWASDLVHGLPSPLSASLYLRAILREHRTLGFGEVRRFLFAVREVAYDKGRRSARPLLTYMSKHGADPSPLFDEQRFDLKVALIVETTRKPDTEDEAVQELQRAVRFAPFLGGNVRRAQIEALDASRDLVGLLAGHMVYIDETQRILTRANHDAKLVLAALAMANMSRQPLADPELKNAEGAWRDMVEEKVVELLCSRAPSCQQDEKDDVRKRLTGLLGMLDGLMCYLMPLGYRRITNFVERPDARPIKVNGELAYGLHAFVEAAHGITCLLGPRGALDPANGHRPWWRPNVANSMDEQLVYCVKGEAI